VQALELFVGTILYMAKYWTQILELTGEHLYMSVSAILIDLGRRAAGGIHDAKSDWLRSSRRLSTSSKRSRLCRFYSSS